MSERMLRSHLAGLANRRGGTEARRHEGGGNRRGIPAAARAAVAVAMALMIAGTAPGAPADTPTLEREILVPFEDLNVLLESGPRRVLLSRQQYAALRAAAQAAVDPGLPAPPRPAAITGARYRADLAGQRATIHGRLDVAVLAPGIQVLPLDLSGVGLRGALLDGQPAPLGRRDDGAIEAFVAGVGAHELVLDLVAPVSTESARQKLDVRLPTPPVTQFELAVAGDVEVEHGAAVVRRRFDADADVTRMDLLLPRDGPLALHMTLNSRLERRERLVVGRGVTVAEVTQACEKLHATFSMGVLHRPVAALRFAVPDRFEITDVTSPLVAGWTVGPDDALNGARVLNVRLREPTARTVVLGIGAVASPPRLADWRLPDLRPLDVASTVGVVGLLLDRRLNASDLNNTGLVPVDTDVLKQALPPALRERVADATLAAVAAFYAPQASFELVAAIAKDPARLRVNSSLLMLLEETGHRVRGGFDVQAIEEPCTTFAFAVPEGWHLTSVSDGEGAALAFERFAAGPQPDAAARVRIDLPRAIAVDAVGRIHFEATRTPARWLEPWDATDVAVPQFTAAGASRERGAIAIDARDDLVVLPLSTEGLTPLDEKDKPDHGFDGVDTDLAYQFAQPPYAARLRVERPAPRINARTFAFIRVEPDHRIVHYEIIYAIGGARARSLALSLPESTPVALSVRGLDDVALKGFRSDPAADGMRRWHADLTRPRRGNVRLAVDFQQRIDHTGGGPIALPLVRAADVAYQSGMVAVEGSAELTIAVSKHPRRVDIGELVDADYQPGRHLLGAFQFVGEPPPLEIAVTREPAHGLPPAIVQHVRLDTALAANGVSQTAARFHLRATALFLEIRMPPDATLWSCTLDGRPTKPQQDGPRLLLDVPADPRPLRELVVVYEAPVRPLGLGGTVRLVAPALLVATGGAARAPHAHVPVADAQWHVTGPRGYRLLRTGGTLVGEHPRRAPLAIGRVADWLLRACGGWGRGDVPANALVLRRAAGVAGQMAGEPLESDYAAAYREREGRATSPTLGDGDTEAEPPARKRPRLSKAPAAPERLDRKSSRGIDDLLGHSSLSIDLERGDDAHRFASFGVEPQLALTWADARRLTLLQWGVGLAIGLWGLARAGRPVGRRAAFIAWVGLIATGLAVGGSSLVAHAANAAFYAAVALVPLYLLIGLLRWITTRGGGRGRPGAVARTMLLVLGLSVAHMLAPMAAAADDDDDDAGPPVAIPADAIVMPYTLGDPSATPAPAAANDRLLIPYDRYVALWNAAHPDQPIDAPVPPAAWAMAGAVFSADLAERGSTDVLLLSGRIDIDVFADGPVRVPLRLAGGVLTHADLDGAPARLAVVTAPGASAQARQQAATPRPPAAPLLLLHVSGRGRHRLDMAVSMKIEQRGGWRRVRARLPAAPATMVQLTIAGAGTTVRLEAVADRAVHETTQPGERIRTALGPDGQLAVAWRPRVGRGAIDQDLKAESRAVLDVQEDGLRLSWSLALQFPRSQRDTFAIRLPADLLVERVEGVNVRGWAARATEGAAIGAQRWLDIALLEPARDREAFTVHARLPRSLAGARPSTVAVPAIGVEGAALHHGTISIRRSPWLRLQTVATRGVARTDAPAQDDLPIGAAVDQSPLGVRHYETWRFVAMPVHIELTTAASAPRVSARLQTIFRIAEQGRRLESRILLEVRERPIYRLRVAVPEGLEVTSVSAPGAPRWSVRPGVDGGRVLTVRFATGPRGTVPVVLHADVAGRGFAAGIELPRLVVMDVQQQEGQVAVQIDPAFDVSARDESNCRRVLLEHLFGWLQPAQRGLTRLALQVQGADYGATLVPVARQPEASCTTITVVRVTDRAIEETLLLDFAIRRAGIRGVAFQLPAHLRDARVSVPLLRAKRVEPLADDDGHVRVTLALQDQVMGSLRVLIESDRLLTAGSQQAPIPVVETGSTERRFVVLENAGRDEAVVESHAGLQPLARQDEELARLRELGGLGQGETREAFVVRAEAGEQAALVYKRRRRELVETAGARIGLASTQLVLDEQGSYRAAQVYRVDNRTEQHLEVELPPGARLWTATVAGAPVKPTAPTTTQKTQRRVRVPLVKTAAGDLDFEVVVKYGGRMEPIGRFGSVRFPLIRTVNINVELSQVRLLLPRTHHWFAFGGTMRPVSDPGAFAAGYMAYQTKKLQQLVETLSESNLFAQVRALENVDQLRSQMDRYAGKAERFRSNVAVRQQRREQSAAVEMAERRMKQVQPAPSAAEATRGRDTLNRFFGRQENARALNVVQDIGDNFKKGGLVIVDDNGQAEPTVEAGVRFNDAWIAGNSLGVVEAAGEQAAPQAAPAGKEAPRGGKGLGAPSTGLPGGTLRPAPAPAPKKDMAQRVLSEEAKDSAETAQLESGGQRAKARRYQERRGQGGAQSRTATPRRPAASGPAAPGMVAGQSVDQPQAGAALGYITVDAGGPADEQAAGLASLDLDLPRRGVDHGFTTPRGDIEITARAVSVRAMDTLRRLGLFLLVALAVVGARRWSRQCGALWRRRHTPLVLTLLGAACLLLGIVPLAAIVLLVIGLVVMVGRAMRRRAARALTV